MKKLLKLKKFFFNSIKTLLVLLLFINAQNAFASSCYTCEKYNPTKGMFLEKVTGVDFLERKSVEKFAQIYLRATYKSPINLQLKTKSAKALRNGEFEKLKISSSKIRFEGVSLSDFKAESICPYNKFLYKKDLIGFPYDIPVKFETSLTNDDLNYMTSYFYSQNKNLFTYPIGRHNVMKVNNILWKIENNKLRVICEIRMLKINTRITLTTGITVKNGRPTLNYISGVDRRLYKDVNKILLMLTQNNPLNYTVELAENANGKLDFTDIYIKDNKLHIKGVFLIPKNCVITNKV